MISKILTSILLIILLIYSNANAQALLIEEENEDQVIHPGNIGALLIKLKDKKEKEVKKECSNLTQEYNTIKEIINQGKLPKYITNSSNNIKQTKSFKIKLDIDIKNSALSGAFATEKLISHWDGSIMFNHKMAHTLENYIDK